MAELERTLASLVDSIDWPETDLAPRLRARLARGDRAPRVLPRWARALALVLLLIAAILATPGGRQAVADLLGVTGISITWGEPDEPVGTEFDLGQEVTLAEAASAVGFPLLVPADEPDTIYRGDVPAGGAVHMVWAAGGGLPASEGTDVGSIYSQFQVTESELFVKSLDPSDLVQRVTVRGAVGFWVEGAHYIVYRDLDDDMREEEAWLSGNVLAWEEGGVTHRVETMQSLDEALTWAESLELGR